MDLLHVNCSGKLKNLSPCHIGSVDLLPFLGFGLFWGQLLVWVAAPVSIGLLFVSTDAKAQAQTDSDRAAVASFRAFGGGWQSETLAN